MEDRVRLAEYGLPADKRGLTAILKKSAALPLDQFFFLKSDFRAFTAIFQKTFGYAVEKPETYQDGAEAAYRLLVSGKEEETCLGLLNLLKKNYRFFFEKIHNIEDESLEAAQKSDVIRKMPRQLCLEERIRRADDRKTGLFPVILLPVQQLYLGTCTLTGSYYPARLYQNHVQSLVRAALEGRKNIKNTVVDMAMMGCCSSEKYDADALFLHMAVIPYILIKEAKEDFEQYGK
ncbi:MAG: hypothetical protein LUH58_11555 [Lachnospiraceae bacterium]|nr:hypothetical protein [Lachnospiraceae bacterium]